MEYEKNPNKKPYKSVLSNAWWSLRGMIHGTPVSLLVMVLEVPLAVFLAWGQVRLPALVVGEVTRGESLRHAALAVGLFLLAMLTATVLRDTCETVIDVLLQFYRSLRSCELDRKTMGFRYQTLERKETRDLGERAGRSTWMWNGVQPLSDVPRRSLKLAENLLCYALLGTVLSGVSPWLVLLLTLAPVVNILCARAYRKWQYAARPARTDLSRRLRYVCAEPADFAAWKDIRVYGMAGWFRALYRDLLDRDLVWTGKDGTREFLVKLADLLVILLRDGAAYAVLITEALPGADHGGAVCALFCRRLLLRGLCGGHRLRVERDGQRQPLRQRFPGVSGPARRRPGGGAKRRGLPGPGPGDRLRSCVLPI